MKNKIILPAFFLMVLAQLYVPASMIFHSQTALAEGNEFMFKTAPIDPSDPFRGKYIVLSFEENAMQVTNAESWNPGDPIFVLLTTNENGFAKISAITKEEPLDMEDYVEATIGYIVPDSLSIVTVQYPFDRFYMEESKAEHAELAYNEAALDSNQVTYALVAVKKGIAVVKDVYINGVPVREAAMKFKEESE